MEFDGGFVRSLSKYEARLVMRLSSVRLSMIDCSGFILLQWRLEIV